MLRQLFLPSPLDFVNQWEFRFVLAWHRRSSLDIVQNPDRTRNLL